MSATFVVVPEWQGSGSSRAMRLIDGAEAVRGDLPSASTVLVEVPAEAGESLETGIHRFSSISAIARATDAALEQVEGLPIIVGGDCGVEFAAVRAAVGRARGPVALVWFDAHADLNTPESSSSGAFHGMVLRALVGDGPERLVSGAVVSSDHIVLAGTRALDDAEADYADEAGIPLLSPDRFDTPDALIAALRETTATEVYIHVDLDVLDPSEINGVAFPEPFGLTTAQLTGAIRAVRQEFELVGAGITEFAPRSPDEAVDDLPTILRIVSALVR
jgi:arginase